MSEPEPQRTAFSATLESVTKLIALFGIASYVIGVLITNSYLQSVGTSDFSALKIRFLYVGATAFTCLGVIEGFIFFGAIVIVHEIALNRWKPKAQLFREHGRSLVTALVIALLPTLAIQFLSHHDHSWFYNVSAAVGNTFGLLLAPALLALLQTSIEQTKKEGGGLGWAVSLFFAILTVFSSLAVLNWYAIELLPVIPPQLGGVKPVRATLVLNEATKTSMSQLGIRFQPGFNVTVPLEVIYESDQWTTLRTDNAYIVIDNKEIRAIRPYVEGAPAGR